MGSPKPSAPSLFIINTKLIKFQFGVLLSALGAFIVFFVPLESTTKTLNSTSPLIFSHQKLY
jgi:hypothetical protein